MKTEILKVLNLKDGEKYHYPTNNNEEKALELFEKFGVYDFHPENTGNGWVKNIEESKKMALKVADD